MRPGSAPAARTAVDFDVPPGACDCHVHVFGDPVRFPFARERVYTPPPASVEELLALQAALRLERVVVVQHLIAALKDHLAQLSFPVVFDHFGGAAAPQGPNQPGFDALLELVRSSRVHVKISGAYRGSQQAPNFADVTPLAQALIAANPDRVVWGTDWPHPNSHLGRDKAHEIASPVPINDGALLNQLPKWAPDAAIRRRILVDNPARLYGFEIKVH